jgi:AcrR family transcriptional regulator
MKKTATGGRPTRAAAEQIEARIVDVARDLFFAYGYGATSIETIARNAGISKRTFYHRFENKAAIFRAVVNQLIHRIVPGDVEILFTGGSADEILNHLATVMLAASLAPDTLALQRLLIAEATRFPELALVMAQQGARQDGIKRIADLLRQETTAGRRAVDDPAIAAEIFMQLVIGLPQRRALGLGAAMSQTELNAWVKNTVAFFLRGYRPVT